MKQKLRTSRSRDFPIVLAARSLSLLGDTLLATVLALRMAENGQPWRLTVVYVAFAVPLFVLAPWAGRIVDEFDSRWVVVIAGLAQSGAALAIAWSPTFPMLVAAVLLLQVGQVVSSPAWSALVPRIVGTQAVGRATGHLAAAGAVAGMAGAAVGGFLYGPLGFHGAVLINAVLFVGIALAGLAVRTRRGRRFDIATVMGDLTTSGVAEDRTGSPAADPQPARSSTWGAERTATVTAPREGAVDRDRSGGDLATPTGDRTGRTGDASGRAARRSGRPGGRREISGWAFCRRDVVLAALLPALWVLVVVGEAITVAEVFLIRGVLGASATMYGICGAAMLMGSIVGPLLAGRVSDDRARIRWCAIAAALFGASVVAIGLSPSVWMVVGLAAGGGVLMGALNALIVAVILVRPPEEIRGRVMATVSGTLSGFSVLALVFGGLLVQAGGARATFVILGVLVVGTAVLIRRVVGAVPPPADVTLAAT